MTEQLTLNPYKEPLTPVPHGKGFGFYGALSSTENGGKLQCHICGCLVENLASHSLQTHKVSSVEYKERFKLAKMTALWCEVLRNKHKERMLNWWASQTPESLAKIMEHKRQCIQLAQKSHKKGATISLETRNIRGTCPEQIVGKIREVYVKLGHRPTILEMANETGNGRRFEALVRRVFGSWTKALELAGIDETVFRRRRVYLKKTTGTEKVVYTDAELLEYLKNFHKNTGKIPSHSDFVRGYFPAYDTYLRRFGGITKARALAGF